jgi:transcriptional regulator with XRE-family HTH domain
MQTFELSQARFLILYLTVLKRVVYGRSRMTEPFSGPAQLRELTRPRFLVADLARRLGVSATAVYWWIQGEAIPTLEHRRKLQRICGIPVNSWTRAA